MNWDRIVQKLPENLMSGADTATTVAVVLLFIKIWPDPSWTDIIVLYIAGFGMWLIGSVWKSIKEDKERENVKLL